jgi:hypothetical protein
LHILNAQNMQTLSAFLVLVSVVWQWMREDSAHVRSHNLSAAVEIFANGTYFLNMLSIIEDVIWVILFLPCKTPK